MPQDGVSEEVFAVVLSDSEDYHCANPRPGKLNP
jgi:hypothetical protein